MAEQTSTLPSCRDLTCFFIFVLSRSCSTILLQSYGTLRTPHNTLLSDGCLAGEVKDLKWSTGIKAIDNQQLPAVVSLLLAVCHSQHAARMAAAWQACILHLASLEACSLSRASIAPALPVTPLEGHHAKVFS